MKKKIFPIILITSILSFTAFGASFIIQQKPVATHKYQQVKAENCTHSNVEHHERVSPTLSKSGHIEYYYCPSCAKSFYDAGCTQEIPNSNYGENNKLDGRYLAPITGTFSLLKKNIRQYLDAKTESAIILALRNKSNYNDQCERVLTWQDTGNGPFTVELSEDREFTNPDSYTTNSNIFVFDGIFVPGQTYYYRVKDVNSNYLLDDCSFRVDDTYSVRTMRVDGVANMRDIGGWTAKDGIKIPYGKVYRGGNLASITPEGIETFLGKLGIKTEIDLREDNSHDLDDARLNYQQCAIWNYTRIIPDYEVFNDAHTASLGFDSNSPAGIKKFFELMANANNYPFYAHCTAGADRTGTFAFLINGLLGVSYEDLTKDFELTTFSIYGNRYRSDVVEETMTFNPKGTFNDGDPTALVAIWDRLYMVMMQKYGTQNGKLYSAIENYLKTVCGISDETIAAVRYNMLDQVVDFSN